MLRTPFVLSAWKNSLYPRINDITLLIFILVKCIFNANLRKNRLLTHSWRRKQEDRTNINPKIKTQHRVLSFMLTLHKLAVLLVTF